MRPCNGEFDRIRLAFVAQNFQRNGEALVGKNAYAVHHPSEACDPPSVAGVTSAGLLCRAGVATIGVTDLRAGSGPLCGWRLRGDRGRDHCPSARLGDDMQRAVDKFCPLAHAEETETPSGGER